MDVLQRFMSKVNKTDDGCWLWTGAKYPNGYGEVKRPHSRSQTSAHRMAWELFRGPVPEGLTMDHLCMVKACVNPDHLEPVTQGENTRRAWATHRKTRCKQGHDWSGENDIVVGGHRRCRICLRARAKERYAANPEYWRAWEQRRKARLKVGL